MSKHQDLQMIGSKLNKYIIKFLPLEVEGRGKNENDMNRALGHLYAHIG